MEDRIVRLSVNWRLYCICDLSIAVPTFKKTYLTDLIMKSNPQRVYLSQPANQGLGIKTDFQLNKNRKLTNLHAHSNIESCSFLIGKNCFMKGLCCVMYARSHLKVRMIQKCGDSVKFSTHKKNQYSFEPKGRSPLAISTLASIIFALRKDCHKNAARRDRYVRSRQWNCFIFLLTNSVEALLKEE